MEKNTLKQIIIEQKVLFEKDTMLVVRSVPANLLTSTKIIAITGVRRCGKSTLMKQLSKNYTHFNYFNFEDERLMEFSHLDLNLLLESFLEMNPNAKTFFFDEIQLVIGWEKFVRRLFNEGYKIFVTGSNAKLLSSEFATSLSGRNLKIELYPFSFKEYLSFLSFAIKDIYTTKEKSTLAGYLDHFIKYGGFPEVILSKDFEELSHLYQDILIKDLIVRFKIKDSKDFRELSLYLLSNIASKISYNNLKNLLNFSNTSKVKNYVDYLSEAYLFFTILKYDPSMKKQLVSNRKIYAIDTGIINAVSFKFSENNGKVLENIVFLELKRRNKQIFYFDEGVECDFLIKEGLKIVLAIQVAAELSNPKTREREFEGLRKAMGKYNLKNGLIITTDHEEKIGNIQVIPLWKWLLYDY